MHGKQWKFVQKKIHITFNSIHTFCLAQHQREQKKKRKTEVFSLLWSFSFVSGSMVFFACFFFGVLGKNENEQKKMTMEKHTSLCWFVYALQIMRSSNLFVLSCCGFSSNPCKPIDIPKSWIQNQKNCVGTKSKEENYWCLSTQKHRQIFEYKVKRQILEAKKEETPRT